MENCLWCTALKALPTDKTPLEALPVAEEPSLQNTIMSGEVVSVVGGKKANNKLTSTLARQQPQSPVQVLSMEEEGEITGGTGGEPGGNRGKPGENGGGFTGGLNAAVEFFPDTEEIIGCDRIITRLNKDIVRGRWRISSSINSSSINSSSINSSSINSSSSSSSRRW